MLTDDELAGLRVNAAWWLRKKDDREVITRENATEAEPLALDVLDLLDHVEQLKADLKQHAQLLTLFGNHHAAMSPVVAEALASVERNWNQFPLANIVKDYRDWLATHPHVNYGGITTVTASSGKDPS